MSAICSFCLQGPGLKSKCWAPPEILSSIIQTYFPVKREEAGLWHHTVVQDLNLPGWWQSVQAPGCGVSQWSCQARPRRINRIPPWRAGWHGGPRGPLKWQAPWVPRERLGIWSLCSHAHSPGHKHTFAGLHPRGHIRTHNLLSLNRAPKKIWSTPTSSKWTRAAAH